MLQKCYNQKNVAKYMHLSNSRRTDMHLITDNFTQQKNPNVQYNSIPIVFMSAERLPHRLLLTIMYWLQHSWSYKLKVTLETNSSELNLIDWRVHEDGVNNASSPLCHRLIKRRSSFTVCVLSYFLLEHRLNYYK